LPPNYAAINYTNSPSLNILKTEQTDDYVRLALGLLLNFEELVLAKNCMSPTILNLVNRIVWELCRGGLLRVSLHRSLYLVNPALTLRQNLTVGQMGIQNQIKNKGLDPLRKPAME